MLKWFLSSNQWANSNGNLSKNISDRAEVIGTESMEVTFVNNVFKLSIMIRLVKELPIFYDFGLVFLSH